jgi:type IV pilus assembly protein PilM
MPASQTLRLVSPEEVLIEKRLPLGVDFGTTAIKLVQIGLVDRKPQIINLIIEELPQELWDKPLERKRVLPEIFKKIAQQNKIKGEAITCLPSSSIQMKTVKLPPMPQDEIDSAVKWEVKQTSTIPLEDLSFDYYIFDEGKSSPSAGIEVMVITCSKKDVFEQIDYVRTADLIPVAVDIDSLSSVCALIHNSQIKMEEVVLFLEFGCHSCSINIIVKNQIYFKRELAINGDSLTQAIAKHCNLSYEDAEGLKQTLGLIGTEGPTQDIQTNGKEVMVNEALWLHLENLIQEIDYTFKYFVHQFTAGRISKFDRIILSGGSANLNRFSSYLNGYLSVPVEIADPLKGIPLSPEIISKSGNLAGLSPRLSVAAGLALRELV